MSDENIEFSEENLLPYPSNEVTNSDLFSGKIFSSWEECDSFFDGWSKKNGFHIKKDRVLHEEGNIRRRTYLCVHGGSYESKSKKDTSTKKTKCPFLVNVSCPKTKNPSSNVVVNKLINEHNHSLSVEMITFEEQKKFTTEMMEDIKFLTSHCKFSATAQRKFLEGKYPSQPIYSKDLYAAIQKFRPTSKSLLNDAALMSNWLDHQKECDSRWVIVRGWDDDNTLTRNSLANETFEKRFENLFQDFSDAKPYLKTLYQTKTYWAHCFTSFKFTAGMIATSRVEAVNACLKRLLYNSNISLCDLMTEIHRLLDMQDKKEQYNFWKLAIPCIRNQEKSNFLFRKLDNYLEKFLTPIMLQRQRDEINQSVYYTATKLPDNDIETIIESSDDCNIEIRDASEAEVQQITLKQIIALVDLINITEIWSIIVNNTTAIKHYIVLLKNNSHICSCLSTIQQDLDGSNEPFFTADKFCKENDGIIQESPVHIDYLCAYGQDKDFLEEGLNTYQQRLVYGELHGMYKKALHKALQNKSSSQQLIDLLKEFTEETDEPSEDENFSDKENQEHVLHNPKKRRGKGRPLGTKRFKSSQETKNKEKHQRRCKKCGNVGHYQKNCNNV
ncbi:unnamed protein product [Rhizophagus irregularis]|uniref:CCHC-type domain-containing protein n=1 Tax=Rhizophagus irregularis TaxID=588596 RepID=A0A915YP23_9GLOM|nr:unnamed protein product [Rhizophagus irregularis]